MEKINTLIFDLDGTLICTKELHKNALNLALEKIDPSFIINDIEHKFTYDGLPTKKKLELLTKNKNLSVEHYDFIWKEKQKITSNLLKEEVKRDIEKINVFSYIKNNNFNIAIASNSIFETVKICLLNLGLTEYVDYFISNEDVRYPKPSPEIYLKTFIRFNISPKQALIFEDNEYGKASAIASGAKLIEVNHPDEINLTNIQNIIYKNV